MYWMHLISLEEHRDPRNIKPAINFTGFLSRITPKPPLLLILFHCLTFAFHIVASLEDPSFLCS